MSDQVYDPRTTVGAAIAEATFSVAVEAAIKVAQYYVPVLAAPVIKQVFEFVVRKFMEVLYQETEKETSMLIIDLKVNRQAKEYTEAVTELKTAIQSQDEKRIQDEKEKFKARLRDLISLKS